SRVGADSQSQSGERYGEETGIALELAKCGAEIGVEVHAVEDARAAKRFLKFRQWLSSWYRLPAQPDKPCWGGFRLFVKCDSPLSLPRYSGLATSSRVPRTNDHRKLRSIMAPGEILHSA